MGRGDGAFRGRVVAITGAAGGIGRALAARFARAGARLALLDLDCAASAALASELRGTPIAGAETALPLACDVTDPEACAAAIGRAVAELGGIDVLVNNAGITHRSRFAETSPAVIRRVMDVNFHGAVHCTQAALPSLSARRGRIVVTSSVAGFAPLLGRAGYAASKHALHGLFDTLRTELAPAGVSVTIICPSFTQTAIDRSALGGDGGRPTLPWSPVGRPARPEDVAEAIVRAAAARRRLLVLSPVGKASFWLSRLFPRLYERLMVRTQVAGDSPQADSPQRP